MSSRDQGTDRRLSVAALQAGMRRHQAGALAQAEAHYREAIVHDPGNADALHYLGVACSQQGRHDEAIALIGRALALVPPFAAMHLNLGNAFLGAHRAEEAVAAFHGALALEPGNAAAHRNLGSALNAQKRHTEAVESYRRALALRPDFAEAHNSLGLTLRELDRIDEAVACFEQARTLRPGYADAHANLGAMLRQLNRHREGLASLDLAVSLAPDHADAHWSRAVTRLALGDLRNGWEEYEWRRRAALLSRPREFAQPLWLGQETLAGRTILLHSEQGLGDTLQFVRYAPLVAQAGARVLLLAQPSLTRLLSRMEGVSSVHARDGSLPSFDCQCPLMSLPHAFGTELATVPAAIPYLRADEVAATRWREQLSGSAPRVGLVWAGGAQEGIPRAESIDRRRSMTLVQFAPLADAAGVRFVSLQKGPSAQQSRVPPSGMDLVDPTAELADFADTAALVAALDLVITVDTSVAHLAGAMGKPVWILSRFDGCWRWLLERDDSPWYPTARLFRQPAAGDWDSVIARVARALSDWSRDARRPVVDAMVTLHSSSTDCRLLSPATTQKKSPPGGR